MITSKGLIAIEYLTKYPKHTTSGIARLMHNDHPSEFTSFEKARNAVRFRRDEIKNKKTNNYAVTINTNNNSIKFRYMTAEQFTYWLQGFMELTSMNHLEPNQFQIIKDHLKLVFDKQTPDRSRPKPTLPDIARPYPGPYTTNPNPLPYILKSHLYWLPYSFGSLSN